MQIPSRNSIKAALGNSGRLLSTLMILAGAGLLIYVGSQYAQMFSEQRRLARQWQQQQHQQQRQNTTATAQQVDDNGLIRLLIPRIHLDAIVVEGTTRKQLLLGPGHMTETPAPGDSGNAVITAHRDTFFRHIYELNKGDTIEVQRGGKVYRYEVSGKKVVDPEDLSVLRQSKDKRLTLITCYPTYYIGPAPDRLVVFARVPEEAVNAKPAAGGQGHL